MTMDDLTTLDGLNMSQLKTLYKQSIKGTEKLSHAEALERIKHSNPKILAQAEYFLLLIYEAKKSGFEYAKKT